MAVFIVTNTNASDAGSLAQAVADAGAAAGADRIEFAAGMFGQTIHLASTLVLAQDLTINGDLNGDHIADVTISGDTDKDGDGDIRLMTVNSGANVELIGLVLTKGHEAFGPAIAGAYGGDATSAIYSSGDLKIRDSVISQNSAVGGTGGSGVFIQYNGRPGGAAATIWSGGLLDIADTIFSGNAATGGRGGAGTGSAFGGYYGGTGGWAVSAVLNQGTLYLSGVAVQSATAIGGGGGDGASGDIFGGNGGDGESASVFLDLSNGGNGPVIVGRDVVNTAGAGGSGGAGTTPGSGGDPGQAANVLGGGTSITPSTLLTVTSASDSGDDFGTGLSLTDDVLDGGGLSLREAVRWADGDTIKFAASLKGSTIDLNGALSISRSLTIDGDIDGDNKADIILSGRDQNQIMRISGAPTDVDLHSLTLINGFAGGGNNGGAIDVDGATLSLFNSTVKNSIAVGTSSGGGFGGGINVFGGTINSVGSTISNNSGINGGGISLFNAHGYLVDTTLSGNSATVYYAGGRGGGLYSTASSNSTITVSTIVNNSAAAGGSGLWLGSGSNTAFSTVVTGNIGPGADIAGTLGGSLNFTSDDDPRLGVLQDNGGPVHTHAIQAGSPLIDAGGPSFNSFVDAAGGLRTIGSNQDIGAFEWHAFTNATDAVVENTDGIAQGDATSSVDPFRVIGLRAGAESSLAAFQPFDVTTVVRGTYGSLTIFNSGAYTYLLDDTDPDTNALAGGQSLPTSSPSECLSTAPALTTAASW